MARLLDIPDDLADEAIAKYEAVAAWLGDEDSLLRQYEPELYPQGSFRLGTPIRPLAARVYWQVVNTGPEAEAQSELRGQSTADQKGTVRWETTAYAGTHWIEAFVVKDNVCVASGTTGAARIRTASATLPVPCANGRLRGASAEGYRWGKHPVVRVVLERFRPRRLNGWVVVQT